MAKDKKKKKDKKSGKSGAGAKASRGLKALAQNPLLADVVAATLVGAAAALKDSNKARQLAANAGDELEKLSRRSAERGNVMWQLALDIGRRAVDSLAAEIPAKASKSAKNSRTAKPAKPPRAAPAAAKTTKRSTSKAGRKKA